MSDINEMNVGLRWYVVHTYSGYEKKVMISIQKVVANRGLGDQIVQVKIPVNTRIEKKGDEEKVKEELIFPGYVLVKMIMTDETWHVVRNITGVTGFVGPGSKPTPISDKEVADLFLEEGTQTIKLPFGVGDDVVIKGGIFDGQSGTVQTISDDMSKALVLIKRGRRDMPAELDTSYIYPAN
ncbi:MAG: transcription termination/antitermination protein NusG [Clostridia bacterium]|nr:transcription termination/antitermination protein NusG [Clostridia bacterium]